LIQSVIASLDATALETKGLSSSTLPNKLAKVMLERNSGGFSSHIFSVFCIVCLLQLCSSLSPFKRNNLQQHLSCKHTRLLSTVNRASGLPESIDDKEEHFMRLALRHAQHSFREKEVPIGAVIVDGDGIILATAGNEVESRNDVTAHAEISCIRKAALIKKNWRLSDCTLYSTLEPCPMCMGAIQASRIKRVVFGAPDIRMGACGSWINLIDSKHPFHDVEVVGGLLEEESSTLLKRFFQMRRREAATIATITKTALALSTASDQIVSSSSSERNYDQEVDEKCVPNRIQEKSSALHIDRGCGVEDLLAQQDPAL
jgi:tRNA(adenine34) deaminase